MKKEGMTLIEMLTVIAVSGVILGLISSATVESFRSWRREENEFVSWRRANAFLNDFARDAKRSLPGGFAGYDSSILQNADGFAIKFSGDFFDFDEGLASFHSHTVFYRVISEGEAPFVIRDLHENGVLISRRNYRGVESFSVAKEKTGVVRVIARISEGADPLSIERKFVIPVYNRNRNDDKRM